jgi:hypothetical protein
LISRPVPSPEFIRNLETVCGQAWLDGAKSIMDQRFNDGTDHLPLWTISFWKEVAWCHEVQALWKASMLWLDREANKSKNTTPPNLILEARQLLESIPWNSKMSYCNRNTTTLQLANFLGTVWLSDEHINMMVEEMHVTLSHKIKTKVQVADLSFALEITNVREKAPNSQSYLGRVTSQVKEQLLEQLYFPLHVNDNHWIAGMIDFKRRRFSFGK